MKTKKQSAKGSLREEDANPRRSESQDAVAPFDETDIREIRRTALALTVLATLVFVAFIYLYSEYGGPWVDSLDERIGEVVKKRAEGAEAAGNVDEAIELYRQALSGYFSDDYTRAVTADRFASLLLEEGRYEEAIEVASRTIQDHAKSGNVYYQKYQALSALNRHSEASETASAWYEWATANEVPQHRAWARYREGEAFLELGRVEEAQACFLQVHELHPTSENAYNAAAALYQMGLGTRAIPLLEIAAQDPNLRNRSEVQGLLERLKNEG